MPWGKFPFPTLKEKTDLFEVKATVVPGDVYTPHHSTQLATSHQERERETNMLNTMTMKEGYIGTWHTTLNPTAMLTSRLTQEPEDKARN